MHARIGPRGVIRSLRTEIVNFFPVVNTLSQATKFRAQEVRHDWANDLEETSYNQENRPTSSFRTDWTQPQEKGPIRTGLALSEIPHCLKPIVARFSDPYKNSSRRVYPKNACCCQNQKSL
jgi:hypothetical protein